MKCKTFGTYLSCITAWYIICCVNDLWDFSFLPENFHCSINILKMRVALEICCDLRTLNRVKSMLLKLLDCRKTLLAVTNLSQLWQLVLPWPNFFDWSLSFLTYSHVFGSFSVSFGGTQTIFYTREIWRSKELWGEHAQSCCASPSKQFAFH